ncbi:hypothetical protein [Brenneria corticis]|uniref:Uncharacterized protein n=1 Tax=Brenneria corticis TaxID=2173106 RepID=A0A2U1U6J6_9GAMM|nr:hypothetical protein [Brenneria sp. CFCC 11842]PWC17262.1 hypothetical protein DDT56_06965 [Brenneria sp. CFCC 11842]
MASINQKILKALAHKYIWWKSPDEAIAYPQRIIAQVMNIGDYSDVQTLVAHIDDDTLRDVMTHAEAGQFNARSWAYWHYRLDLCAFDQVPPLPLRRFA